MDASLLFETEFQRAIEKFQEYTPSELSVSEELRQIKISIDQFSEFCSTITIPNRKKEIEALVDSFNKCVGIIAQKHTFLINTATRIEEQLNTPNSKHGNVVDKQAQELLRSNRRKYSSDLRSLEYLSAVFEGIQDKIESKLATIETSTIYKLEFQDSVYVSGHLVANKLREELIDAGLIDSKHPNSSRENFNLLFRTKTISPYLSARPIVWLGSYPQLYYLISRLTKKTIKGKNYKPSHIDVTLHVFRDNSEDSSFNFKNKRTSDTPREKELLDKIIKNVESQIFVKKKI